MQGPPAGPAGPRGAPDRGSLAQPAGGEGDKPGSTGRCPGSQLPRDTRGDCARRVTGAKETCVLGAWLSVGPSGTCRHPAQPPGVLCVIGQPQVPPFPSQGQCPGVPGGGTGPGAPRFWRTQGALWALSRGGHIRSVSGQRPLLLLRLAVPLSPSCVLKSNCLWGANRHLSPKCRFAGDSNSRTRT